MGTADRIALKRWPSWLLAIVAMAITVACLWPTLQNGWVNWDDDAYVLRNPMVQQLSGEQVGNMFTTAHQVGLYHPVTMLSLAIDYHFWQDNAFGYHLTNLLWHLVNVLLVFMLMRRWSNAMVAFVVALLFGMHPMHVESVAWVSARKDVLYTAFYLLSLLCYEQFTHKHRRVWWYLLSLLLFAIALLAKSMAFTLPVILVLADYLQGRRQGWQQWLEKLPFLVLSGVALVVAKYGQQASDSMMAVAEYPLYKTLFIGTNNALLYAIKALLPVNLSPFHPFPFLEGIVLPWYYYASSVPFIIGLFLLYRAFRWRKAFFGMAFFLVTIGPVLQIIPFGKAVSAERYTYVAYIGLFYLVALAVHRMLNPPKKWARMQGAVVALMAIWVGFLGVQTYRQAKVWNNGATLWSAVVERYPRHYFGYLNRGVYYSDAGELERAKSDFDLGIALNPPLAEGYYERGRWHEKMQEVGAAVQDYTAAVERDAFHARAYLNRGALKGKQGDLQSALADFDLAVKADSSYALAYLNRALVQKMLGQQQFALSDFDAAIALEPWNAYFYRHRGVYNEALGLYEAALNDFGKAATLEPSGEALFLRSQVHLNMGNKKAARQDAEAARKRGLVVPDAYWTKLEE